MLLVVVLVLLGSTPVRSASDDRWINSIQDVVPWLKRCWINPPLSSKADLSQITVLFSLKRNGELLGRPRITYQSNGEPEDVLRMREAAALALARCNPFPITDALGAAIAGRPFRMTLTIARGEKI